MGFLDFTTTYEDGDILSSSEWNAEFNQIVAALGSAVIANPNKQISITGQTDSANDGILILNQLLNSDILETGNGSTVTNILANGQLQIGANGIVGLVVASNVKCSNLNADLLDGKHSTDLQPKVNMFDAFQVFWIDGAFVEENPQRPVWIVPEGGAIITKLKAKQRIAASANASTVITVRKNGSDIGTVSISGNTQAVQTSDITDVPVVENDIIEFEVTTHTGDTEHENITAAIHFKKKLFAP